MTKPERRTKQVGKERTPADRHSSLRSLVLFTVRSACEAVVVQVQPVVYWSVGMNRCEHGMKSIAGSVCQNARAELALL